MVLFEHRIFAFASEGGNDGAVFKTLQDVCLQTDVIVVLKISSRRLG